MTYENPSHPNPVFQIGQDDRMIPAVKVDWSFGNHLVVV